MTKRRQSLKQIAALPSLAGALVLMGAGPAIAETATDQRCAKDDDVRLIEIRFADANGNLPCKVIYRPAAESDTIGIVSWQDIEELAACEAQAKEVTDRLTEEGWTCFDDSPPDTVAVARPISDELDDTNVAPEQPGAEASPGTTAEPPLAFLPFYADDLDDEEVDEPAKFVENPDIPAPSNDLVSLIQDDLKELDTTLDGILEAMVAGYGDLNGDTLDDALVLYTYNSPQPAYRQFLVAYVSDGDTYQLTATRPVSGNVSATMDARVEAIDGGVIHMTLQAYEPGDASCCPSGERHLALTLRELDLVEIDADAPTR